MSMTRNDAIKCDECGRFISLEDLVDGKATHNCVLPDSEFSVETFESICAQCNSLSHPTRERQP
jgi:Zn finger protein HypA/HybF involved in hydrogenase expression